MDLKLTSQTSAPYSDDALRLEAIFRSATDGMIIIDENGAMELVNEAAARLFGYSVAEMLGQNVNMIMPEPHQSRHDQYLRNYRETGRRKIIGVGREVEGMRKDGTIFPCRLSISEALLKDRRIFTGIVHDLTIQKEIEKALQQEKDRVQQYLDVANNIFVVIDRTENITMLNRKGCEVLGCREDEALGKNWFDLVIPENGRERIRKVFRQIMDSKLETSDYFENEIITHNGDKKLIAWRNAIICDENNQPIATLSSGIDITEQRAAEERIKKLNAELEQRVETRTEELAEAINQLLNINKQLEYEIQERKAVEGALRKSEQDLRKAYEKEKELSELKSRFVSMASHEFRTPLSTILSSADLIDAYIKEDQQGKREKHTNRIKSAVANLTGILNDFLSLSKLEEGNIRNNPVEFEINSFCEELVDEIQGLLKSGQQIRFHREKIGPHTLVFLDKKFLKNVFLNLLSNAIKYSGPGTRIDCSAEIINNSLHIEIADQGIGIPEEEQQHLFTRFFRARNVENIQGTGLGLNIVKRYVELMKGNITFESQLGKGTTFFVNIPIKKIEY